VPSAAGRKNIVGIDDGGGDVLHCHAGGVSSFVHQPLMAINISGQSAMKTTSMPGGGDGNGGQNACTLHPMRYNCCVSCAPSRLCGWNTHTRSERKSLNE
jgi:hypothetical protein